MVAEKNRVCRDGGRQLHDTFDIGDEPHVEHSVRFVDDQNSDIAEQQFSTLEVVEQASRRGDDDIDAAIDLPVLFVERDAADQQRRRELSMLAVDREVLGDLIGQFPRRFEDQRARHPGPGAARGQHVDHRQGEGGRLARAGPRAPHEVATPRHEWYRLFLDRCRGLIPRFGDRFEDFGT